ncbi:ABC transporter ATP-binding protein [Naumannella halotolerans]|uniref:ATP-binding cassette subfamily B protein n=2 Tax=Naumannella halotolerans TaxID=993414 RepID=A0A4R7JAV7_9ACTN|nr:ATP-binding cassette subfamily B protein [Naumannella halotolerans]
MPLLRLIGTGLRPYCGWLVLLIVLQIVSAGAALYLPTLNARIIDDGVATGDLPRVWQLGAVMAGVSVLQLIGQACSVFVGAWIAACLGRDIRERLFARVLTFSAREFDQFGAPTLITRNTNDVQQVQQLVLMAATLSITAPITMVGGVILAIREDAGLAWLIAVSVGVLVALVAVVVTRLGPRFRRMQLGIDTVNRILREQITGIRVVRAFVAEPAERERFARANQDLTAVAIGAGRWMAAMFPIVLLVSNLSGVAVVWFGAFRIIGGDLQVGQLTAYISYLIQILISVMMATFLLVMAPRAAVSGERIQTVMQTESSLIQSADGITEVPHPGRIDLDHVSFCYPGAEHPVLSDVCFSARPGETVAIIGATGSGKTTLLSMIPRLFDPSSGSVAVGGVDVRELAPSALHRELALVPQRAYLFSGTIATNLRYGNPAATDDELWQALRTAQAADFVAELDEGLQAPVSQGGTNFSGGQRQRLSIARALVSRARIILFDDSFSALDMATDARLRGALAEFGKELTTVLVGQRIATVREADKIIVLEDGKVVGRGTHDQLIETCPTYAEIVASQLSAEEAGA